MSHLIKIYTVCSLVFEFSTPVCYSFDLNFFGKFAVENFVVCFLVVKELTPNLDGRQKLKCYSCFPRKCIFTLRYVVIPQKREQF